MHTEFYINSTKMTLSKMWCGAKNLQEYTHIFAREGYFLFLKVIIYKMKEKSLGFSYI